MAFELKEQRIALLLIPDDSSRTNIAKYDQVKEELPDSPASEFDADKLRLLTEGVNNMMAGIKRTQENAKKI